MSSDRGIVVVGDKCLNYQQYFRLENFYFQTIYYSRNLGFNALLRKFLAFI